MLAAVPCRHLPHGVVRLWDIRKSRSSPSPGDVAEDGEALICTHECASCATLDFSPTFGGQSQLVGGGTCGSLYVWDLSGQYAPHIIHGCNSPLRSVEWHPAEPGVLATIEEEGCVTLWYTSGRDVLV